MRESVNSAERLDGSLGVHAVQGVEQLVIHGVSVGLLVMTGNDEVMWMNEALARLICAGDAGAWRAASPGEGIGALVRSARLPVGSEYQRPGQWVVAWQAPGGESRWLEVSCVALPKGWRSVSAAGADWLLYEIADVTAARQREERSRQRERRMSRVESLARVGTWEWRVATGQVLWSDQLLALFGLPSGSELTYEQYRSLLHPEDIALIEATLGEALRTGRPFTYTHRMFLADRVTERIFECYGEVVTDPAGAPIEVLGTARDITEHKRVQDELARVAARDPLTGLGNPRTLTAVLGQRLAETGARPGALLLLDVDNFKDINDLRGHGVGDQVMRALAQRLRQHAPDAVVARLGGDEFAMILPDGNAADALSAAEALCDAVARCPVLADRQALRVTLSVGVAPLALVGDVTALLASADLALYEAKGAGRNRARLFNPGQYESAARRVSVLERVREAVETGLLELHAQPIVDLASGTVTSHELLVRFDDGEQPHLGPADFLPALERTDLVLQLDRWVLGQAVTALATPAARRARLTFDVNISTRTLEDPGFADYVLDTLRAAGVEPTRLGLEITETAALTNLTAARQLALQLTDAGCRFSLDDFGAGFGSFTYLKHLPFTAVKIDGEFVRNADESGVDALLVDAVVRVARGLGMATIAEHVDREPLVHALRQLGVDHAQGFHLGTPRPLPELLDAVRPAPRQHSA